MRIALLLLLFLVPLAAYELLSEKNAKMLIENTPDYLAAKQAGRCPRVELLRSGPKEFLFQIRNLCTRAPSGLIGNFAIDRVSAEVWLGIDRDQLVSTENLRRLQERLKRRSKSKR